jgi:sigma-B regulation protein RsbU (phosphoserine phosphatase)
MIVGVDLDYTYENRSVTVTTGSRLFLFSDGVYEVRKASGKMLAFREFTEHLTDRARSLEGSTVQAMLREIQGLSGADHFDDDFSLLEVKFEGGRP